MWASTMMLNGQFIPVIKYNLSTDPYNKLHMHVLKSVSFEDEMQAYEVARRAILKLEQNLVKAIEKL